MCTPHTCQELNSICHKVWSCIWSGPEDFSTSTHFKTNSMPYLVICIWSLMPQFLSFHDHNKKWWDLIFIPSLSGFTPNAKIRFCLFSNPPKSPFKTILHDFYQLHKDKIIRNIPSPLLSAFWRDYLVCDFLGALFQFHHYLHSSLSTFPCNDRKCSITHLLAHRFPHSIMQKAYSKYSTDFHTLISIYTLLKQHQLHWCPLASLDPHSITDMTFSLV